MHTPALRARRGFTLIEMMVSMMLMLSVIGLSTQLFRRQSTAVSTQAGRLDAQQNSRFAIGNLDRELRMAGVGVVDKQPLLVMAGATAITFNADLVANDTGDLSAVYINPDADSGAVGVLRTSNKVTLPGTSKLYPDTTYMQNTGIPSSAETISYWLSADSTSTRSDDYVLFRRANARPPRVVARGIIYNSGDTIFRYFKRDTIGLTAVSPAILPLIHTAPIHGTNADTAKSAMTDSILQVRVQFKSVFRDPRTNQDIYRTMQSTIYLMNAGLIRHSTCGNAPLGVAPTVTATAANGTTIPQTFVTISWTASVDEATGEKDVERYALYRRLSSQPNFEEPFASVPAGTGSYVFNDTDIISGQTWTYGVAALDCTPLTSPVGAASQIVIP